MAESISIPLTHIQNLLDGIAPSWVNSRLDKLKSMLIQIQRYEDCRLQRNLTDESTYLQNSKDIRCFAYDIDDQLDSIYVNIESYRRWVNSGIPRVIKTLAFTYYKCRVLQNIKSLIDLVQRNKVFRSGQDSNIRELNEEQRWEELQMLKPLLHRDYHNFSYDFEGRLFFSDNNSYSFLSDLGNNKGESIIEIDISRYNLSLKTIYDSIRMNCQTFAWVSLVTWQKRLIIYRDILKQLLSNDKKKDVVGLMSMKEDEVWKELMEVLTSNKCLILLTFDYSIYDKDLVDQFNAPMESRLLVITNQKYEACRDPVYCWKLLESITFPNQKKG